MGINSSGNTGIASGANQGGSSQGGSQSGGVSQGSNQGSTQGGGTGGGSNTGIQQGLASNPNPPNPNAGGAAVQNQGGSNAGGGVPVQNPNQQGSGGNNPSLATNQQPQGGAGGGSGGGGGSSGGGGGGGGHQGTFAGMPTTYMPVQPKMGGLLLAPSSEGFCALVGGEPYQLWTGLDTSAPTEPISSNQLCPFNGSKSRHQPLGLKWKTGSDLVDFKTCTGK
jgi:hypothetical protein